jgi:hypothetical protein
LVGAAKEDPEGSQIKQDETAPGVASRSVILIPCGKDYKRKPSSTSLLFDVRGVIPGILTASGGRYGKKSFFFKFFHFFSQKTGFFEVFAIHLYIYPF